MRFRNVVLLLLSIISGHAAEAEIRLPQVLSDHAVLQRGVPLHVWGWAAPGSKLTVQFHDQSAKATADDAGEWSAWLNPEQAGGPFMLSVDGDGSVSRTDLLVGDVWLASGQSNMEFPLKGFDTAPLNDSAREIAGALHPKIRLLSVPRQAALTPQNDIKAGWSECNPTTAANFSAVAYFFGRQIADKEGVPIGLIDSTWGGTPADSWMSMDTLGGSAAFWSSFHSRAIFANGENRRQELSVQERRQAEEAKVAGKPAPYHPWHPSQMSWLPSGLYNGMISPLTPYAIKGVLWYQGETNSRPDRYRDYATLFPALIRDWRARFGQGDLPFLYVQISSYYSPKEHWGVIRDAQRRALDLRNTAMAVTLDVGNSKNVHPADKQTVGARLALAARGMVYGEKIEYESPQPSQITNLPGALRVWFLHAEGLAARGAIDGFEVAGNDGTFVPAVAKIENQTIVVSSPKVSFPISVRYAWASDARTSLYNGAGLPLGTFTSEQEPQE